MSNAKKKRFFLNFFFFFLFFETISLVAFLVLCFVAQCLELLCGLMLQLFLFFFIIFLKKKKKKKKKKSFFFQNKSTLNKKEFTEWCLQQNIVPDVVTGERIFEQLDRDKVFFFLFVFLFLFSLFLSFLF